MRLFLWILCWSALVFGAHEQNFGLGGESTSRVGGVTADASVPFATVSNPALLAAQKKPSLTVATATGGLRLQPLQRVLVDSPRYRTQEGTRERVGDHAFENQNFSLWSLDFSYPFSISRGGRRAALGATLTGPFSTLRNFVSETPYSFQPLRYGARDPQFRAIVGASLELLPSTLYFGGGASFYISAAGSADAVVVNENPNARMRMDVGLNSSAIAGLFAQHGSHGWSVVYRQASSPRFEYEVVGRTQVGDGAETLDIPISMQTTLYYEPHTFEADWQYRLPWFTLSLGVVYQLWSAFEPPYMQVTAPRRRGEPVSSSLPPLVLRNTWSPRASVRFPLASRLSLGGGYQFRPSPLEEESLRGAGNLVDASVHVMGVGAEYAFAEGWFPFPLKVGASGQWHFFETRDVRKENSRVIGAPGYQIEGHAFILALSMQAQL